MNIAFCLPGRSFTAGFVQSWTQLLYSLSMRRITPLISMHYSPVVYFVRNMCLGGNNLKGSDQKVFESQNDVKVDYVMWIDSDIVFNADSFFKLYDEAVQKNYPIISGLYPIDDFNYSAIETWDEEYFIEHGTFKFINKENMKEKKYADNPIIKVPYNGFGFMLIKKEVFDALEYPWFKPEMITIKRPDGSVISDFASEDASFCLSAARKGFDTWVDTEILLGHEKSLILI